MTAPADPAHTAAERSTADLLQILTEDLRRVIGDLALERGLHQPFRQRLPQPALSGRLQAATTRTAGQPVVQLLIDRLRPVLPEAIAAGERGRGARTRFALQLALTHGLGLVGVGTGGGAGVSG
jgi:hypothetical protein